MIGEVKQFEVGRKVAYGWCDDLGKGKEAKTLVVFEISKKGTGSMLRLTHSGFGEGKAWVELYGGIQSGWAYYLMNLKSVLSQGQDLRSEKDWA